MLRNWELSAWCWNTASMERVTQLRMLALGAFILDYMWWWSFCCAQSESWKVQMDSNSSILMDSDSKEVSWYESAVWSQQCGQDYIHRTSSLMHLLATANESYAAFAPLDGDLRWKNSAACVGATYSLKHRISVYSSVYAVTSAQKTCVSSVVVRHWLTWPTSAQWLQRLEGWQTGSGWRSVGHTRVLLLLGSGWSILTWSMLLWPQVHLFMPLLTSQVRKHFWFTRSGFISIVLFILDWLVWVLCWTLDGNNIISVIFAL